MNVALETPSSAASARASRYGLLGEVVTGECARWEGLRHHIDCMSATATEISDVDASPQSFGQPVDQRQDLADEISVEYGAALFSL